MKKAMDKNLLKTIKKATLIIVFVSLLIAFFVPVIFSVSIIKNDISKMSNQINKMEKALYYNQKSLQNNSNNKNFKDYLMGYDLNFWEINKCLYEQRKNAEVKYDFFLLSSDLEVLISSDPIAETYSKQYFKGMTNFSTFQPNEVIINKVNSTVPIEKDFLMMYKGIYDKEVIGYIVYLLDSSAFGFLQSKDSAYSMTDYYDNVIFSDVPELIRDSGTVVHVLSETDKYKLKDYYHIEKKLENHPYKLHRYYSISETLRFINIAIILVCFLSVLIFIIRRNYYNRLIKDNLMFASEIRTAIHAFSKGDLTYRIDHIDKHERQTYYFIEKYNEVLELLEETIQNSIRMKELVSDAERKLLLSQFNPHFIFNVLETIKYSLPIEAEESIEMVESLSKIMRYSLDTTKDVVFLHRDIQYIQEYLKLQKLRYEDRLDFRLLIDEKAAFKKIPKLIIQPLVENSIKHGFKDDEPLNIDINIYMDNNNIVINIKDDGAGINTERLTEIQYQIDAIRRGIGIETSESIGIINTVKRLSHSFDDRYIFMIESSNVNGTSIMIVIEGEAND